MGTIDLSTEALLTDIMVSYALAALLLPALAMAGKMSYGVRMEGMMQPMMQQNMMQQMAYNQMGGQMMAQNNGNWWGIASEEDQEAYMKWCEERKMQMKEQEEAKELLRHIQEEAEEKKHEAARMKMMREAKAKRESMVAQWRMWQSQLKMADEFDSSMSKYTDMKVKYMFALTMDYLKFCKCSDDTAHLQKYLMYGSMTYEPGMGEAYSLDQLEGIDINNEEAVAQRMATLSDKDNIQLYFTGMIMTTCDAVKQYIETLKRNEDRFNFIGM